MLLGNIVLLVDVPLQRREDATFLHQVGARVALDLHQCLACYPLRSLSVFGWDREVLELLAENDDGLFCKQRILRRSGAQFGGRPVDQVLLRSKETRGSSRAVERVRSILEEGEYIGKALGVEL